MPAARGVKRTASKTSASAAAAGPKNKKKRGAAIQLEVPSAPKRRGRVYACGQGDVGQLGLGEDVPETSKFKHVSALGDKIVDVCAGGMHTIALDSDGKVWTFGCNDEGALGRATSSDTDEGTPRTVALPRPAVAISAGDSHSAALLDNGDVYAWGAFRDSHGSMGLVVRGREGKPCREPARVDVAERCAGVASGGDHLVVLSSSGGVYTMGCGEQGQLGRLTQRSASRDARQGFSALLVPSKVTLKISVSRVWAGYHATFALDGGAGKMFAWGLNNYGQLGITGEKRKTALFAPIECDAFGGGGGQWARVACGQHHSLALDAAGRAYCVGRCEYGRLGLGDRAGDAETLEPIPKLQGKRCVSIAAGTSNSFAVTDSGEVLSWGMGSEGQLGTGSSADASEPTAAVIVASGGRVPARVSAGGQHTVLLLENTSSNEESSPAPAKEKAEEKMDSEAEDSPEEKEKEREKMPPAREKGRKRKLKEEQDEEISSTSSAQPDTKDVKQKLNGKDKVDTPMDVDETDKPQDKDDPESEETKTTDEQSNKDTEETEHTESEKEDMVDTKTDTMDTSSQDTTESDKPDSEKGNDVEMEVNGTPEKVETKTVELIPSDTALTTSA